jgi:hypothetical protein
MTVDSMTTLQDWVQITCPEPRSSPKPSASGAVADLDNPGPGGKPTRSTRVVTAHRKARSDRFWTIHALIGHRPGWRSGHGVARGRIQEPGVLTSPPCLAISLAKLEATNEYTGLAVMNRVSTLESR